LIFIGFSYPFSPSTTGTFVQNLHNSSRRACPLRPGFRDLRLALSIAIFSRSTTHGYSLEDLTSELFNLGNNGPKFLPPAIAPTFFHPPRIWIRPPARRAYASERLSLPAMADSYAKEDSTVFLSKLANC